MQARAVVTSSIPASAKGGRTPQPQQLPVQVPEVSGWRSQLMQYVQTRKFSGSSTASESTISTRAAGTVALVPRAPSSTQSEVSWAGPHFHMFRNCIRRSRSATDSVNRRPKAVTEEGVAVTPHGPIYTVCLESPEYQSPTTVRVEMPVVKFLTNQQENTDIEQGSMDIRAHLELVINASSKESVICVSCYTLDCVKLSRALINARRRGCEVQVLCDHGMLYDGQSTSSGSVVYCLVTRQVKVRTFKPSKGGRHAVFHTKMLVIEDDCVINPSANWSTNSHELCIETGLFSREAESVRLAVDTFKGYWARGAEVDLTRLKLPTTHVRNRCKKFLEDFYDESEHASIRHSLTVSQSSASTSQESAAPAEAQLTEHTSGRGTRPKQMMSIAEGSPGAASSGLSSPSPERVWASMALQAVEQQQSRGVPPVSKSKTLGYPLVSSQGSLQPETKTTSKNRSPLTGERDQFCYCCWLRNKTDPPVVATAQCAECGHRCCPQHKEVIPYNGLVLCTCCLEEQKGQRFGSGVHQRPSRKNPPIPRSGAPPPKMSMQVVKYNEQG